MYIRLACSLLAVAAVSAHGQTVPVQRLAPASGHLTTQLTSIASIREVADGRLLLVDEREQRLFVGDFGSGDITQIGRPGDGPGEYRYPRVFFALPGDTTILPTSGLRWLVLIGATIAETWGPERTRAFAARGLIFALGEEGRVFSRANGSASCHTTESTRPDTVYVVLSSRNRKQADTIGYLLVASTTMRRAKFADGRTASRCTPRVLPSNDEVAQFPDGWIAIARPDPYRVDWRNPVSGVQTRGAPILAERPRVTESDRKAIIDSFPSRPGRMPEFDFDRFPERAPAFQPGALVATPDGRVLIRRTLLASATEARYDIVDRASQLVGILTMGRGSRIAGFGHASVYVVTTDADGLQRIARHPWP